MNEHEATAPGECEVALRTLRDLQASAAALADPLELPDVAAHLLALAQRFLDAPAGVVSIATAPGRFEVLAERGLPDESVRPYRRIELDEAPPHLRRMLEGEEHWLETPEAIAGRFPVWADFPGKTGTGAWAFVPIRSGNRPLGTLSLFWQGGRAIDRVQRSFLRTLAQQGGFALDRARLIGDIAEAKGLLDALFEAAPAGVAFVDRDLSLRRVNAALAAAVRRPAEELIDRPVEELLGPEKGPEAREELARVLATGTPVVDRDIAAPGSDGGRHFLTSVFRVDAGGRTIGVGGIVRDVTELRRAEEFRRNLLAIVGHDLRSPLAAITVSVGLLLRRNRAAREVAILSRILASAGRMERILRDLLDWASAEAGQTLPLAPRETSIALVCRGTADEAMAADPSRTVLVEGDGDPRGSWDPDRLGQALGNLVGNALKHGRPGRPVRVRWTGDETGVTVEVENEGEPIPPELRRKIFEPFRKGAATDGPGGGLGLGLYIARELVRAHGGSIWARSERGTTTFTLRLPRQAAVGGAAP